MLRIGIIGTGRIARRHMQALEGEPHVWLFLATSAAKADAFAQTYSGQGFDNLDAFIRNGRPDVVLVTVPPHRHGDIENRLIAERIPFLVEKPLSADRQVAERIAERLAGTNLVTAVGYHWRALDTLAPVRAALNGRPPRLISGRFHIALPKAPWWQRQSQSGGQFNEQACHLIDLARLLAGEARVLCAAGHAFSRPDHPAADVLPASVALLRFQTGALGTFSAVNMLAEPGPVELEIAAEGIGIRITLAGATISTADGTTAHVAKSNPYATQDRAFLDAVRRGDRMAVFCSYEDALLTHRICQDITEQALASST